MIVVSWFLLACELLLLRLGLFTYVIVCVLASGGSKTDLPSSYPLTPEAKAAAAKKYNMRVEDYKPHTDQGEG